MLFWRSNKCECDIRGLWHARGGERREYIQSFGGDVWDQNTTWKKRTYVGDYIGLGLQETGLLVVDCINLAQDTEDLRTVVNTVLNFRGP
jgi:hypothetical protein